MAIRTAASGQDEVFMPTRKAKQIINFFFLRYQRAAKAKSLGRTEIPGKTEINSEVD